MKVIQINNNNKQARKAFLKVPILLYKQDPNWVRPLDKDIESIFDPQLNPGFQQGKAARWVLEDAQGQLIGRIAAFYDQRKAMTNNEQPTGGIGFFECIRNQDAANLLFDTAKDWLSAEGMEAMDGPINFGERNRWWGLLVDNFGPPSYCINYNPPFYRELFENYGFKDYFQQYTYKKVVQEDKLGKQFYDKAERLLKNKSYHFEKIDKTKLEKYIEDLRAVYNASWVKHEGVPEMTREEARKNLNELKPILDDRLVYFAYYNETPIGFMVLIPELNQIFKYVNGKLDLIGKLKFVYYRWRGAFKRAQGLIIGIVPRFQGRGVESGMMVEFSKYAYADDFPYVELEFNWVGDFLPAMSRIYESLHATVFKTHITYRYLFDQEKPFQRHPVIK